MAIVANLPTRWHCCHAQSLLSGGLRERLLTIKVKQEETILIITNTEAHYFSLTVLYFL